MDHADAPVSFGQALYHRHSVTEASPHGSFNGSNVSSVLPTEEWINRSDNNKEASYYQPRKIRQCSSNAPTSTIPYLEGALTKACVTASSDSTDPATVQRARSKINALLQTIGGITSGLLKPGSRTPIADTPVWLTPMVLSGGFATGHLAAGGLLTDYETELAHQLGISPTDNPADTRSKLNRIWLSEPFYSQLCDMLDRGTYRVNFPEESVMLVVVALHRSGHNDEAEELINTIAPFMGRVRFFPKPAQRPLPLDRKISMMTVSDALTQLKNRFSPDPEHRSNTRRRIEKNALVFDQWLPLKNRLLKLMLDTVKGEPPYYNETGELCGGTPLTTMTPKWTEEARRFQADRKRVLKQHPELQHRSTKKRGSERILLRSLEIALANPPENQSPSDRVDFLKIQGNLRKLLADIHHKQGVPGTQKYQKIQDAHQLWLTEYKNRTSEGQLLITQLLPFKDNNEISPENLPRDLTLMPAPVKKLFSKLQPRELAELLEQGDIPSSEVLASKLLAIVPIVKSESITDPTLATLFAHVGRAFNKRRSLLLQNFQSQVKMDELPWVKPLQSITPVDKAKELENARNLITDVVLQTFAHFPYTILPNPFLKSLTQLINTLPKYSVRQIDLTHELASDIFEHGFSERYLKSAKEAAELMQGTLYEKYYGLEYDRIGLLEHKSSLYNLCHSLSGVPAFTNPRSYRPHDNGKIIEWQQIITTHNLATLTNALCLHEYLQGDNGAKLSHKVADWIVDKCSSYNPEESCLVRLHEHKNIAFAFRQMLFFLSFQTSDVSFSVLAKLKTIPTVIDHKIEAINSRRERDAEALESMTAGEALKTEKIIYQPPPPL